MLVLEFVGPSLADLPVGELTGRLVPTVLDLVRPSHEDLEFGPSLADLPTHVLNGAATPKQSSASIVGPSHEDLEIGPSLAGLAYVRPERGGYSRTVDCMKTPVHSSSVHRSQTCLRAS